jgi:hypothetical protein
VKPFPTAVLGFCLCAAVASAQTDKFVQFPGGPKLNFTVPMGYSFEAKNNADGSVGLKMENPVWNIVIHAVIAVENDPEAGTRKWQESMLISHVAAQFSQAQQTDYEFVPLTPIKGSGIYCVFSALGADRAGGETLPGESTHVTSGIKTWPGRAVLFRIFSNGVTSEEYREAFDLFSWSFTD